MVEQYYLAGVHYSTVGLVSQANQSRTSCKNLARYASEKVALFLHVFLQVHTNKIPTMIARILLNGCSLESYYLACPGCILHKFSQDLAALRDVFLRTNLVNQSLLSERASLCINIEFGNSIFVTADEQVSPGNRSTLVMGILIALAIVVLMAVILVVTVLIMVVRKRRKQHGIVVCDVFFK